MQKPYSVQRGYRKWVAYVLLLSLVFTALTGCGADHVADKVKAEYPLESVNGSGKQTSYVYRAAGQSTQQVAASLCQERKPEQQSKPSDERMFLVYPDEMIHIQQDTKNPKDSLIEVDSKEYVEKNYSPGFLEGYLLSSVINHLFSYGKSGGGEYRGYSTKEAYKPDGAYHTPTVQEKKMTPPFTVDRIGSITKRSKNADVTRSTLRDFSGDRSGYGNQHGRNSYGKYQRPRISSGGGRITRRGR